MLFPRMGEGSILIEGLTLEAIKHIISFGHCWVSLSEPATTQYYRSCGLKNVPLVAARESAKPHAVISWQRMALESEKTMFFGHTYFFGGSWFTISRTTTTKISTITAAAAKCSTSRGC